MENKIYGQWVKNKSGEMEILHVSPGISASLMPVPEKTKTLYEVNIVGTRERFFANDLIQAKVKVQNDLRVKLTNAILEIPKVL